MLILTRRIGERLVIGDNTFCTILGVKGNQVRLGVDAPADISVHREEIYMKVKAEKELLIDAGAESDLTLTDTFRAYKTKEKPRHITH